MTLYQRVLAAVYLTAFFILVLDLIFWRNV
jgi:hypothetical protein